MGKLTITANKRESRATKDSGVLREYSLDQYNFELYFHHGEFHLTQKYSTGGRITLTGTHKLYTQIYLLMETVYLGEIPDPDLTNNIISYTFNQKTFGITMDDHMLSLYSNGSTSVGGVMKTHYDLWKAILLDIYSLEETPTQKSFEALYTIEPFTLQNKTSVENFTNIMNKPRF